MAGLSNSNILSNKGPKAFDRRDMALEGDRALQRQHNITKALAASSGQAGLEEGNVAKQKVAEELGDN